MNIQVDIFFIFLGEIPREVGLIGDAINTNFTLLYIYILGSEFSKWLSKILDYKWKLPLSPLCAIRNYFTNTAVLGGLNHIAEIVTKDYTKDRDSLHMQISQLKRFSISFLEGEAQERDCKFFHILPY